MKYLFFPIISLILGMLVGSVFTFSVPIIWAKYLSVALLAALDSLLGGIRAVINNTFNGVILLSGFFTNALMAAALAFLGDKIGLDLYLAAVIALGIRIFQNLGYIRRMVVEHLRKKYQIQHQAKEAAKNDSQNNAKGITNEQ